MKKIIVLALMLLGSSISQADDLKIVVSLKPIHGMVEAVMKGVDQPDLLISENASPHHFSFTPSQANLLAKADLVIWVGPQLEQILEKPLGRLSGAKVVKLLDTKELQLHTYENGLVDPHIWLSPENALKIVDVIRDELTLLDPENKKAYADNARKLSIEISLLAQDLAKNLGPVSDKNVFVYHDAYHYFEASFNLKRSIPILNDAEHNLRAKRRLELESMSKSMEISCVFGEPNHGRKTVESISEQLNLKKGLLDPLGSTLKGDEENSYLAILNNMAQTYISCTQN